MLPRLFIKFGLLLLFGQGLIAQQDKKVVVTGIKYILVENSNHLVNSISFPFYFNDDVFLDEIAKSLINSLKERFEVQKVTLLPGAKIIYGTGRPVKKLRAKIPEDFNENDIYVELASYFSYHQSDSNGEGYKLVTLVSAFDYQEKILFRSENNIPFKVRNGDWIQSDTVMNWRDFEYFYIRGLEDAIYGYPKWTNTQTIDHQAAGEYDPFILDAEKLKLIVTADSYTLEKSNQKKTTLINVIKSTGEMLSAFGKTDGAYEFYLKNFPENKGYVLQMFGSKDYVNKSDYTITVVAGLNEGDKISGEFKLDYDCNLTGKINGSQVLVLYNWNRSVAEFVIDNQLIALLHNIDNQRILYYSKQVDNSLLGLFSNLLVTYHLTTIVLKEAENAIILQNQLNEYISD
jgi:hypothetical protein